MKHVRLIVSCALLLTGSGVYSQAESKYFPTGMKWQEAVVEPIADGEGYTYTGYVRTYEIGEEESVNGVAYRKVLADGVDAGLWVREASDCVLLLSSEYPHELRLYDFNWNQTEPSVTEYLQEDETDGFSLFTESNVSAYEETQVGTNNYQYRHALSGTVICGIGRVTELNRNTALLGYKRAEAGMPGLIYVKVLWITRNGKDIFKSETPDEWISTIPLNNGESAIQQIELGSNTIEVTCHSPSGMRQSSPRKGLNIIRTKDGQTRKVLVR